MADDADFVDAEDDEYMQTLKRMQAKLDKKREKEQAAAAVSKFIILYMCDVI